VTINGSDVAVKGPKGSLAWSVPEDITVTQDGDTLTVARPDDRARAPRAHGMARSLVANMVLGVSEGFTKELEIVGVGYRANAQGPSKIELRSGYSHSVPVDAPEGVTFEVPAPNRIVVAGIDKQLVGQVAADIRKIRKPEPYKGKGIRYAGERVLRKAGSPRSRDPRHEREEALRQPEAPAPAGAQEGARHRRASAPRRVPVEQARLRQVIDDVAGRTIASASTMEAPPGATAAARSRPRSRSVSAWPSGRRTPGSTPWSSTAAASSTTVASRPWPTVPAAAGWSSRDG
jgi:large subunit ribosomal protein L6